ncbi:hypothetical protein A3SM_01830, partial [Pseudomonas syringae pv. actinidiae ICMP 18886]
NDTLSFSPLGQRYSPISNTCAQPTGKDMRQELGRHIKLFISLLWGSNHKPPEFPSDELTFTQHTPGCWIARYLGISKNTVTGIVRRHRETA